MYMGVAGVSLGAEDVLYGHVVLLQRETVVAVQPCTAMAGKVLVKGRKGNNGVPYALVQVRRLDNVGSPNVLLDEGEELGHGLFLKVLERAKFI